jgi:hypothetical protein
MLSTCRGGHPSQFHGVHGFHELSLGFCLCELGSASVLTLPPFEALPKGENLLYKRLLLFLLVDAWISSRRCTKKF